MHSTSTYTLHSTATAFAATLTDAATALTAKALTATVCIPKTTASALANQAFLKHRHFFQPKINVL